MLGSSGRHTRRANSVAPDPGAAGDSGASDPLAERIERVEAWYAERGRPAIFKLTEAADPPGLDEALAARGYTTDGETLGMTIDLDDALAAAGAAGPADVVSNVFAGRLDEDWFAASCALSRIAPARRADYRAILVRCLESQRAVLFGAIEREGAVASVAIGSVVEDVVSLVAVATADAHRGERLAESVLRSILFAARERGAERAILNVEAPNQPARRLYERMGFLERYRYWYRERAPGATPATPR